MCTIALRQVRREPPTQDGYFWRGTDRILTLVLQGPSATTERSKAAILPIYISCQLGSCFFSCSHCVCQAWSLFWWAGVEHRSTAHFLVTVNCNVCSGSLQHVLNPLQGTGFVEMVQILVFQSKAQRIFLGIAFMLKRRRKIPLHCQIWSKGKLQNRCKSHKKIRHAKALGKYFTGTLFRVNSLFTCSKGWF